MGRAMIDFGRFAQLCGHWALGVMEIHGAEQIASLLFQKPAGVDWRARLSD